MRAVEEGITVVRSANSGISAVITPHGQIPAKIGLGKRGIKDVAVKLNLSHETLFGQYGNAIPLCMATFLMVLAWLISAWPQKRIEPVCKVIKTEAKSEQQPKPRKKSGKTNQKRQAKPKSATKLISAFVR